MRKIFWTRAGQSFAISAFCGLVALLLIDIIGKHVSGDPGFAAMSPEFVSLFPSEAVAAEVNVLLYGLIGATFAGATIIFEKDRIGFLIQNLLYCLITGTVWISVVMILWRLYKYSAAMYTTIACFVVTHVIMSVLGYRITRQDVKEINDVLRRQDS